MSVGDNVRTRMNRVEVALKDAGAENAVNAIVDVLKEIANALDEVERRAERRGEVNRRNVHPRSHRRNKRPSPWRTKSSSARFRTMNA